MDLSVTSYPSTTSINRPKKPSNNAPIPPDAPLPKLEDVFDGGKAKYGKLHDKFIAATQVPDAVPPESYYNPVADKAAAQAYYADISNMAPAERMGALRDLVTSTHKPEPKGYDYVVATQLYTEVDRHPDGTVRSVYSQEPIHLVKYPDITLETLSVADLNAIAGAATLSPVVMGAWLGFQRGAAALNCEHVVPQSFFDKREPMRSDLHHLYACEIGENSKRGNTPYGSYTPIGGKGEVARATLYFMLRYPDVKTPYGPKQVELLKEWSASDPPGTHELHRNQAIQKAQGNRNPFIDHPEWLADFKS